MKTQILSILTFLTICLGVNAQNVNIPDANFKAYLIGNTAINTNNDSEIQVSEATAFTGTIDADNLGISDLTGIEAFTNITRLDCDNNSLTSLNLSSNLALERLHCSYNSLIGLNLSANTALTHIFSPNNSLRSVNIPSNTTAIVNDAFRQNPITSVSIPSTVTSIGDYAFSYTSLTSLSIPPSVTSIGSAAFYGADFATVTIPSSVTSIGTFAFDLNSSLIEVISESTNPATLPGNAFANRGVIDLIIPANSSADYTAAGWTGFNSITEASTQTPTNIIYVNHAATGANNGTSWADAYTSLQDALTNSPASNNIWVAKGTYKPHATDVDVSFIANNTIYGGFAGTEADMSDRDLSLIHTTNETILSGDLNNDDATTIGFNDTTRDDNSRHVLKIARTNLEVNGFTIKDGNANGTGDDRFGAGIFKERIAANTTIKNCVIKNNVSSNSGAGFSITSINNSIIIIDACIIENNLSPVGSGIDYHMSTPGRTMNITVTNSLFNGNKTDDNGTIKGTGAPAARFRAYYTGVTLTTTLVNNTFVNNSSKGDSGNNPAGNFPVVGLSKNSGDFGTLIIANNIFWDNVTNGNTTALATGKTAAISGVPTSYAFIVNNTDESNQLSSNVTNPNLDANFKLTAASTTAIDGGVNNQIPTGITTDLAGNLRIFNTTVDRGAYEFGSSAPLSVGSFFIEDELSVYPNPTSSILNIKINKDVKYVEVYNLQGQRVKTTTNKSINVSNLSAGMYVVRIITSDQNVKTKRFIKN